MERKTILSSVCKLLIWYTRNKFWKYASPLHDILASEIYQLFIGSRNVWGLGLFVRRKVLKSSEKTIPLFKDY